MTETTTIRVSRQVHAQISALAAEPHETIDETVRQALRTLRQDRMAADLARPLTSEDSAWLDADLA